MSAFMVCPEHVDYLIHAGLHYGRRSRVSWLDKRGVRKILDAFTADAVGTMLLAENQRSVNTRYGEQDAPQGYKYRGERCCAEVEAVQVLKAVACLDYQSCETDDWKETEARAFCQALKAHAIDTLPGYDDALWSISTKRVPYVAEARVNRMKLLR